MLKSKTPVGILGATGIVGQRFIQLLELHPWFEVAWLAASERSVGLPYAKAASWRLKTPIPERVAQMIVSPAEPRAADGFAHFGSEDRGRKSIGRQVDPLPDLVGDLGQGDGLVDGGGGGTPAV